jgi:hypothetical protein
MDDNTQNNSSYTIEPNPQLIDMTVNILNSKESLPNKEKGSLSLMKNFKYIYILTVLNIIFATVNFLGLNPLLDTTEGKILGMFILTTYNLVLLIAHIAINIKETSKQHENTR